MELKEVELKKVDDVVFKRIGVDVPMLSDAKGFSSDQLPVRALAVSNRYGYCLFAHSRGFSVAKTADLIQIAEKLKDKSNAGQTAQEKSVATLTVANIRCLSLSNDELTVAVCAGGCVMFYDLPTLILKSDTCPYEVRKVDPVEDTHIKDFSWSPTDRDTYLILTNNQQLLLGRVGFPPDIKVEKGVLAASWSEDGQHVAYVSENRQLSITTSTFSKSFSIELPAHLSDEDVESDMTVDAIRWVRSDSIIVGYVRMNSEGEEDGYPLFVVTSSSGSLAEEQSTNVGLVFYQLFPSIESFVVPSGSGPYMLVDYLKPWEMVVAASRKSIDDHIVLVGWLPDNGRDEAYSLEIGNDLWIPRIELQECGDDNAIVGLAIDRTTVQIQLTDPKDDAGEAKLAPSPVLICVTLEGKLSLFSFARLDGKWNVPNLVTAPSDIPESKRLSTQGSQASGKISGVTSVPSSKPMDDMERRLTPKQAELPEKKGEEKPSQSAGLSSKTKGDVKDGTVSLFERFTRPSPSPQSSPIQKAEGPKLGLISGSAPLGQFQKSEGPKLGLVSGSNDSRQPSVNPGSALVSRDERGNAYQGLFRPFEDGPKSGSVAMNASFPSALSFNDPGKTNASNKTGPFQNQATTVPSSALAASSQATGVFQKANDKDPAIRPVSPQPQRTSQFQATSTIFSLNSALPGKGFQAGANAYNSGAAAFPGKGFDSRPTNPQGTLNQGLRSSQATGNAAHRFPSAPRTDRVNPASQSWAGQDQQPQARATGLSDMEAAFILELEKVRRMAEEVDQVMSCIEGRAAKDNIESNSTFTRQSLEELEQGIHLLSEDCKAHRRQLTQEKQSVEDLRDESLRVDSWRIYARSLMEQKNDSRHLELWTLQKLHPELDMKRKRVLKADQDLKLKIAEMEKHLQNLELKQWQADCARRRPNRQVRTPGQFLSVQNLYNTVNAQMAVAEELSLSLAQQMETLNITWSSPAKGSTKSTAASILKSVGANPEDVGNLFVASNGQSPISKQRLSYSPVPKGASSVDKITTPVGHVHDLCVNTQETARRRRDSMDATWVESGAPKTTIKRPVHIKPSHGFTSGNSSLRTFRQGKGNVSEVSARESWSQPRHVRPTQSTRVATQSTNTTFSSPGFEVSVSAPVPGRMGSSTSGPQWPLSQQDQQRRSSSTSPNGDFAAAHSPQLGLSSPAGNVDSKESLFKWANNSTSGTKVNPVAPAYPVVPFAKQGMGGTYDGSSFGPTGKTTSKLSFSGSFGGSVGGSYASVPATKPRLLGAFDGGGGDMMGKSGGFSRVLTTTVGNRYGSVSSAGNQMDSSRIDKETNQNMGGSSSGGSIPLLTGPSTLLLTGPKPTPLLTGPIPPPLLTGPTPSAGASASNSQSRLASQRSVETEQESEGRSDKGNQNQENLKQRHVTNFPAQPQSSTSEIFQKAQAVSSVQPKEPAKQSDEIKAASNASGGTFGSSGKSFFDFSSKSGSLGSGSSQSAVTTPSLSGFNFAVPSASAPSSQTQVSKSLFNTGTNTTVETTFLANKSTGQSGSGSSGPTTGAGTVTEPSSLQPFDIVEKSDLKPLTPTTASISSPAVPPPSRFGVQGNTTKTSSLFPAPSVNAGLIPGNASAPAGGQASSTSSGATASGRSSSTTASSASTALQSERSLFTPSSVPATTQSAPFTISSASGASQTSASPFGSSTASTPSQTTASPFASSSASAPSQTSASPFASSSASAPYQTSASPFASSSDSAPTQTTASPFASSSASAPSQMTASPFASSSASALSQTPASPFASSGISGFSTAGTQMTSSPFGQSSMWPSSDQQPFMFQNSSSVASAVSVPTTTLENNEDDMEEEASTGANTNLGGGFGGFGGFGGLGLGSSNTPAQTQKTNPFGGSLFGSSPSPTLSAPTGGQLFRPAAFSLPAAQSQSPPQQTVGSAFGSGFGSSGFAQTNLFTSNDAGKSFGSPAHSSPGGFGQPAQLGPGQQALGSALGAFGQTRQVGFGTPSFGAPSAGGFSAAPQGGGFANAATGGGFAGAAGFTGLGAGGGFAGSSGGCFQAFGQGGQPGFGTGMQPAQASIFTQMRK